MRGCPRKLGSGHPWKISQQSSFPCRRPGSGSEELICLRLRLRFSSFHRRSAGCRELPTLRARVEGETGDRTRHGERGGFRPRCSIGRPFLCLHLCPSVFTSRGLPSSACLSISPSVCSRLRPLQAASPAAAVLLEPGKKLKDAYIATVKRILSARESGAACKPIATCLSVLPGSLAGWRAAGERRRPAATWAPWAGNPAVPTSRCAPGPPA